jgi:hypothetical protein
LYLPLFSYHSFLFSSLSSSLFLFHSPFSFYLLSHSWIRMPEIQERRGMTHLLCSSYFVGAIVERIIWPQELSLIINPNRKFQ